MLNCRSLAIAPASASARAISAADIPGATSTLTVPGEGRTVTEARAPAMRSATASVEERNATTSATPTASA